MKKFLTMALVLCLALVLTISVASAADDPWKGVEKDDPNPTEKGDVGVVFQVPTCTDIGWCHHYDAKTGKVTSHSIPALGHKWVEDKDTEAEPNEDGTHEVTQICERDCGVDPRTVTEKCKFELIDNGDGDCTADPKVKTTYTPTCSVCGYEDEDHIVTGDYPHTWNDGEKLEANCTYPDGVLYTCDTCGETNFVATGTKLNPDKHVPADELIGHKDPKCYEDGYDIYMCKYCKVERVYVPISKATVAHDDSAEFVQTVAPTCTSNGVAEKYCAVKECKAVIDTLVLPAHHEWEIAKTDVGADGIMYTMKKCKVCGTEVWIIGEDENDCPLDHKDAKNLVIVKEAKEATTTEAGNTAAYACKYCGEIVKASETIPALKGVVTEKDGELEYTIGGKPATGLVTYNGEQYFFVEGKVDKTANGLCGPIDDDWYFFFEGHVEKNHPGFALFQGGWFYLTSEGKLDRTANYLKEYEGEYFFFAKGQLQTQYTGIVNDVEEGWIYLDGGRWAKEASVLVDYDGYIWYVKNGKVDFSFNGVAADMNGTEFTFEGGRATR